MRNPLLFCAVALPVSALAAQSSTTRIVRMGQEVRLSLPGDAVVRGILVRVAQDTVFLALTKGASPAIPRNAVLQTEVRERGGIGAGAARGAKIGAVVGLGVGVVGALTPTRCESGGRRVSCDSVLFGDLAESVKALMIIATPLLGAAVGGVVGTVVPPMVWRRAELPSPLAAGAPPSGGTPSIPFRAPVGIDFHGLRPVEDEYERTPDVSLRAPERGLRRRWS